MPISSGTTPDMLENNVDLSANGLTSITITQDVLVDVFDYNGDRAYMVTNSGYAGTSKVIAILPLPTAIRLCLPPFTGRLL